ncbi:hypothetical protein [uncultured Thiodictyon sp.]|jgi:hypothetical protein|uniref:hypothetical protein n=1 Tax=uncultured Thiodictyon sp. TaxID=1846217 RepID=UPI0025F394ED|nr:hypothetical protein [uncultured Thiodictyon sp.]
MNKISGRWWVGLLGLMLALPLAAVPLGRLEGPAGPVAVGESFDISVYADGVGTDEVIAFGFDLDYAATWTFIGAAMGPGFTDDSTLFPDTMVAGNIDPSILGPSGDNILLATLSLRPSVAGRFNFGVISNVNDPNEGLILFSGPPAADLTTSIQVEVSAPGSLALLGLGLAGLPLPKYRRAAVAPHA